MRYNITPYEHSFSRILLDHKDLDIRYANTDKVLLPRFNDKLITGGVFTQYMAPLKVGFITSDIQSPNEEYIIVIKNLKELKNRFGVGIKKRYLLYRGKQKFEYFLVPYSEMDSEIIINMPSHIPWNVIYNLSDQSLSIGGPYSDGKLYYLRNSKRVIKRDATTGQAYYDDFGFIPKTEIDESIHKRIWVGKEIPVGIDYESMELITIPPHRDSNSYAMVGLTGSGKSFLMHTIQDFNYWYGIKGCFLNDWDDETAQWCKANDEHIHKKMLGDINIKTRPLPVVYLNPHINSKEGIIYHKDEKINEYITLKWSKFISEYYNIAKNFPDMDLGAAGQRLDFTKLSEFTNMDDLTNYIDDTFREKTKANREMKNAINARLGTFFQKGLLDISSGIPAEVDIYSKEEKTTMPTLIGLMYAGLYPVLRTRILGTIGIGKLNMLPIYFNFLIKEFYDFKVNNKYFKNEEVHIAIDEFDTIIKKGGGAVAEPLLDIITLGRHNRVGWSIAQQNYISDDAVLQKIKNNVGYLFCFKQGKEEARAICRDYESNKEIVEDITKLGDRYKGKPMFECYIFPRKHGYNVYNLNDGSVKLNVRDVRKITIFPPLSRHYNPEEVIK